MSAATVPTAAQSHASSSTKLTGFALLIINILWRKSFVKYRLTSTHVRNHWEENARQCMYLNESFNQKTSKDAASNPIEKKTNKLPIHQGK